jgi:hypothetical protein
MSKKNASLKSVDNAGAFANQKATKTIPAAKSDKVARVKKPAKERITAQFSVIQKLAGRWEARMARSEATLPLVEHMTDIKGRIGTCLQFAASLPDDFAFRGAKRQSVAWVPVVGGNCTWGEASVKDGTYAFTGTAEARVLAVSGEGRRMRVTISAGGHTIVCPRSDLQAVS